MRDQIVITGIAISLAALGPYGVMIAILSAVAFNLAVGWFYLNKTPSPPAIFNRFLKPKIITAAGHTVYEYRGRTIKFCGHVVYSYELKYPNLSTKYVAQWTMDGSFERFTYFALGIPHIIVDFAPIAARCYGSAETFAECMKEVEADIQNALRPPACIDALRALPMPIAEEIKRYYRLF